MPLNIRNDTKTTLEFYLSVLEAINRRTNYYAFKEIHFNLNITDTNKESSLKVTFPLPQGISLSKQTPFSFLAATVLSKIPRTVRRTFGRQNGAREIGLESEARWLSLFVTEDDHRKFEVRFASTAPKL